MASRASSMCMLCNLFHLSGILVPKKHWTKWRTELVTCKHWDISWVQNAESESLNLNVKKTQNMPFVSYTANISLFMLLNFSGASLEYNKCCRSSYIKTACASDCKNIYEISYKCKSNTLAVCLVPTLVLYDLYLPCTCLKCIINLCWREPLSVFTVCFIWKKNVNRRS